MAIELKNSFTLNRPVEETWALLNDVERIAPYVPGAKLTGVNGDEYEGSVAVKLGPITAQYKGSATITGRDEATKTLTLTGKGRDVRGQGTAGADLVARVVPDGAGSRVDVTTDVQITGKVAQLGKGIMQDVSARLIDQFVANLTKGEDAAPAAAPASAPAPAAQAPARSIDAPDPEPIDLMKVGGGVFPVKEALVGAWMIAVLVLLAIIAFR